MKSNVSLKDIQIELSRRQAWEFCLLMNEDFFEKRKFLRVIADTFQYLIEKGNTSKEIINRIKDSEYVEKFTELPEHAQASMSPRAGKSYILSLCCTWALGKFPAESILRGSSSQKLYRKFSRAVRYFVTTEEFKECFPGIVLSNDNSDVDGWSLKQSIQGSYFGSGVDGQIVGWGASLIALTDDLYKSHNDAMSDAVNERTNEFMESAFDSRKEKECNQFDIGTRWTKSDYMGRKIDNDYYDIIIRIPALDDNDKSFCEDVMTTDKYIEKREKLTRAGQEYIWDAEYQQEPIEVKGLLFPSSKLKRFKKADLNLDNIIGKVLAIDTADEGTDYYSAPLAYLFQSDEGIKAYIPKVIFSKESFKYTEPRTINLINDENIDYTILETNKEGSLYLKNLKTGCPGKKIAGKISKGKKETRILFQSEYILDFYFLEESEQDDDYRAFMKQLTSYLKEGNNKDDAPDSLSLLSKVLRIKFGYKL